jgi:hypothetical protein
MEMLAGDIAEARFLASLTKTRAQEEGLDNIAWAAHRVEKLLGPAGSLPTAGYGSAMLRLADIIGHDDEVLPSPQ